MSKQMKIMSFNMRVNTKNDGVNCFDLRKPKILSMLKAEDPDVIGFQEVTDEMLDWLVENLPDYVILGHGRAAEYNGEGTPIAYRRNRFLLHAFREKWLSLTPNTPASKLKGMDQSGCPRIYCCAELVEKESHKLFAFYNTHLDHKGTMAQVAECTVIYRDIVDTGLPYSLMGDFNANDTFPAIQMVLGTAASLGTVDATANIPGTFHGYLMDRVLEGRMSKIDHIFTNMAVDPTQSYAVADDNACGNFYSDHNAICAFISFAEDEVEN
ncbi:MAG: endonuclease/exonuclease/phosphatase family protein [Clostridia bacterium]|nr:endonuclease/exonuclease/phosphatase family protein [Clostridia bacterium]